METQSETLDKKVRYYVYDTVLNSGKIPTIRETAAALSQGEEEIGASFKRLADAHVLVLQKASDEILMANPFSAVPTPFLVKAGGKSFYGNCIWDAMGVPAMLGQDAVIEASCGCCSTAMTLEIKNGEIENPKGIVHFAIPAKRWWDDIVYN